VSHAWPAGGHVFENPAENLLERISSFQKNIGENAAHKMMVNLTPVVNFINVKCTNFSHESRFGSFYYLHVTRKMLRKWRSYKKFTHLTLMKLTPGRTWFWAYDIHPARRKKFLKTNGKQNKMTLIDTEFLLPPTGKK